MAAGPDQRPATADSSWVVWTMAGIAAIWVAVVLISLLAPDMVTGSEQQHLPVAAFGAWFWGLAATGGFLWGMGRLRGNAARQPFWIGLAAATIVVWAAATILSITLPVYVTGSDPTRLPIGAMVSPVAAALLTTLGGIAAAVMSRPPEPG
jgi:hypothetical protein